MKKLAERFLDLTLSTNEKVFDAISLHHVNIIIENKDLLT